MQPASDPRKPRGILAVLSIILAVLALITYQQSLTRFHDEGHMIVTVVVAGALAVSIVLFIASRR
jgi:hypothetical protein